MQLIKTVILLFTVASTAMAVSIPSIDTPALVVREEAVPTPPVKPPPASAKKPGKFGGNSIWAKKKETLKVDKAGAKLDAKTKEGNSKLAALNDSAKAKGTK
ncbi:hypothetical protein H072_4500 [Dactylellina haptotyla CBS 200.50]|uniref:Uncharacterized protein n=1 Tax=Dactylellina haptotyla (strain CBS 200.50) TaxID=1284197 RepID=S8AKD2_DACHA|nr:hypothetical protein H072_4500 [Dactylellina haptotyla CBS 200.50]